MLLDVTAVGVDVDSRSIAIARLDPSSDVATRLLRVKVPTKITERAVILRTLREELEEHQDWFADASVYVEAPVLAGAKNIQSTIKVAGVYGLVLAVVSAWSPVTEVAISSWKKATHGSGNANKDDVATWLALTHPAIYRSCFTPAGAKDQNLVDASCIALYGYQQGMLSTGVLAA